MGSTNGVLPLIPCGIFDVYGRVFSLTGPRSISGQVPLPHSKSYYTLMINSTWKICMIALEY